ncbi:MAG: tetratricopeptide repeat protein [Candidatus Binatia bacterium]
MLNIIITATTLLAAFLHFTPLAAAQVTGELAHNRLANDEQLSDAASLHQRALGNLKDGNPARALEDLHASIQLNPYYTQSYYLRGQIFAQQKDFSQAIHDFDKAIAQDSAFASALHQRALAHQERRDYRQALKDFNNALALEPLNALTLRDRAIAHRDAGNYDQAVDDYEAAMRLGFSAVDPHPMADLLFFQGRFLQSAQTLQQVVRSRPDNRHAALWRYLALGKANDDRGAGRELAEQSARAGLDKRWPAAVFEYYLGKIDESSLYAAAETAEESIKTEQQCQANFYVAEAKLLKGAKDEAIARLLTARSQCPPNTSFFHGANAELKRFGQ